MNEPLVKHLALISESAHVTIGETLKVSAALQKQCIRDLAPIWGISATIDAYQNLEDIPLDYWPMIVRDDIGFAAAGIHLDRNGQPFALISSSTNNDVWSLTASHEALEMLVDPFGERLIAGDSILDGQGRVNYLVEVCDPSEDARFAYTVNGVLVSDFYTPSFFDPLKAAGVRYSYTGALDGPRKILAGGYVSWVDLETNSWWQQIWFEGDEPTFRELGQLETGKSIRSQIDRITAKNTADAVKSGRSSAMMAGMPVAAVAAPSRGRADALHAQIDALIAGG